MKTISLRKMWRIWKKIYQEDDANEDEGMDMEVDEDENDDDETQEEYYSDAE